MAPNKFKLLSRVSPRLKRSRRPSGLPILKLHRLIQKKKKKSAMRTMTTTITTITTNITTNTTTTTITYPALMNWETTLHTLVYDPKPLFHPMSDNAFWVRHFRGAQQESPPPSPRRPPPSSSFAAVPTASSSSRKRERS